jgi:hypothetical protein
VAIFLGFFGLDRYGGSRRLKMRNQASLGVLAVLLAYPNAYASDNSKSSLEVFKLLAAAGSRPISDTPPPPIDITPKPPTLQTLMQNLASAQQILGEQVSGLASSQQQLAFWQTQPAEVAAINVPYWSQLVSTEQRTIASLEAQVARLQAQIKAR